MVLNHQRDKLINAIIYFANNTQYLGKIKLCKLLYFLDFEHFKQTGRPVTGLDYYAWPMGPVPKELYDETSNPKPDMAKHIQFSKKTIKSGEMLDVKPISAFNSEHFSNREFKILKSLAQEFNLTKAENMVEATHLENQPWHKIYEVEKRKQQLIPYELAIRKQEFDEILVLAKERTEFIDHFS